MPMTFAYSPPDFCDGGPRMRISSINEWQNLFQFAFPFFDIVRQNQRPRVFHLRLHIVGPNLYSFRRILNGSLQLTGLQGNTCFPDQSLYRLWFSRENYIKKLLRLGVMFWRLVVNQRSCKDDEQYSLCGRYQKSGL